ncbi:8-oxo-dGTP pyrophosphatase MutT (NUDIX family) [Lederbergia wuyishanensis]|uniref:8-oxo-dGTP pyrophosphatase MutT (NUDIX family) n=1 Tax=Lederbergia wuyishanensis TaxID=1347903 RepID=A0ABU0D631_9BACI|nr:8-oxo-dGTP pyrophosphatase MutT (NUDIX family) [Lederbergia wuyishanensis]
MIQDEKVLLVKHTYQNHWYLPGGGVEKSETLERAIRRECKEEIGADLLG